MTDLDATLVEKVPDIRERHRKPDVEHHRQADDLRAPNEVAEFGAFGRAGRLAVHTLLRQAKFLTQQRPAQ